jgi:hypothetical protein
MVMGKAGTASINGALRLNSESPVSAGLSCF